VDAKLHEAISLRCDMERNITRPEEQIIAFGITSTFEDRRGSAVGFGDDIGKDTHLVKF
jgi:hypothetical protein